MRCACPIEAGRTRTSLSRTSVDSPYTDSKGKPGGNRISSYFVSFFASSSCRRMYPSYLTVSSASRATPSAASPRLPSQERSRATVTSGRRRSSA